MSSDLDGTLSPGRTVLYSAESDLESVRMEILEGFDDGEGYNCVYLSTVRPHSGVEDKLRDAGRDISRFFFIDTVSKSAVDDCEQAIFTNPRALTDLSIALTTAVKSMPTDQETLVVIDTFDGLLLYNDAKMMKRFIHSMNSRLLNAGATLVVLASGATDPDMVNSLAQYFDHLIRR